jgi:hypothetical protein
LTALLPRLPGSEPLDRRIAIVFLVLTAALLAPSVPGIFEPTDAGALKNAASALDSSARQLLTTIDARDRLTEPYYRAAIDDIGDRVAGIRDEVVHRPVAPDASALKSTVADAADKLAIAADALTVAFDNPSQRTEQRATVADLEQKLKGIGP